MLRWRLLSSAILIPSLLLIIWLDLLCGRELGITGLIVAPIIVVFAVLAVGELLGLFAAQKLKPLRSTVYLGTALVVLAACVPLLWKNYPIDCPLGKLGWPLSAMALCVGLAFLGEMRRYKEPGGVIVNVALSVFAIAYVGLLLSFLCLLRGLESGLEKGLKNNEWGMIALLAPIIIVKVSDSGAYTVGRLFGKHKLAPRLSPGKTIEGAVGAIVTGCLASWLVFQYLAPALMSSSVVSTPWWASLLFGLIVTIAGILGDLAESLIKRDMDRKDSSTWIPGLGGVLDILDSILFAAPAAYACFAVGLVGP